MYEILKQYALDNDLPFEYSKHDFRNLFDNSERKDVTHIFLDPVEIEDVENDTGVIEERIYSGFFMLLVSSDIDKIDYDTRYQEYIKPIINTSIEGLKESIRCKGNVLFNTWKTVEVINALDYNFDGVIVTYNITIEAN